MDTKMVLRALFLLQYNVFEIDVFNQWNLLGYESVNSLIFVSCSDRIIIKWKVFDNL